jgi:Holliday junction resolvasome RuvABC endonuclease subunit
MKKMKRASEDVVVGIDQSAAGSAAVELVDGRLGRFLFFADSKRSFRELNLKAPGHYRAIEPVLVKGPDDVAKVLRLRRIRDELTKFVAVVNPTHVAFEAYSSTRMAIAARVLGEVGGVVRLLLSDLGVPFRLYEVDTVKMFATGRGDAEKAEMILACRDRWDEPNWTKFGKTAGAAGNLADAYVIAQILHLELAVRAGDVAIEDLDKNSKAVLLRTTPKKQPIAILDLPFVEVPR